MFENKRRRGRLATQWVAIAACAMLAGCASDFASEGETKKLSAEQINSPVKFTSKEYGVAVSQRVIDSVYAEIPRGGGRAQVGKPYKIRGKWYKPRHQPNYDKTGIASWYGPNFHGRKTANGEIYDQTALSAAHPTLPLPSYVRVTNLKNKRSVIVRVNDRGPFVKGRIIDLSYRTAELLDTAAGGLAKVRVQYVGKARLDAQDEDYLLASYRGPGSVEDSKVASREKLLAFKAGRSGSGTKARKTKSPQPTTQIARAETNAPRPMALSPEGGNPADASALNANAQPKTAAGANAASAFALATADDRDNFDSRFFLPATYDNPSDFIPENKIRSFVPKVIRALPDQATQDEAAGVSPGNAYVNPKSVQGRVRALQAIDRLVRDED
ncbi:MAG: septal ring lytic transglycosylase RlpA family protein [Pseudomonadota bacterium]